MAFALRFPLVNQTDYKGTITFQSIIEDDFDVADLANDINASSKKTDPNETIQGPPGRDIMVAASDLHQFINGVGNSSKRKEVMTGNGQGVQLFLPQAIQIRDGASYKNIDLGAAGAVMESAIKSGTGAVGAGMQALQNEGSSLIDALTANAKGGAANLAAVRASQYFGDTASGAVSSALRTTINPNSRALFESVPLREFTFQFKLIPNSQKEAEAIKRIIKFFRTELYPEDTNPTGQGVSLGYKFPNKFDIRMSYSGRRVATGILPAYLRDVTVAYNSGSMGFFYDGNFTDVDLNVSFLESRPLKKTEIAQGY
jgi:hypothetical protein